MPDDLEARSAAFRRGTDALLAEIGKAIVGQRAVVREAVVCLLAGGHALLEGVPGLGKTLLVRTLAEGLALSFRRIQFTPDLMPADITGTNILSEDEAGRRRFEFQPGPIFGHVVLADEVNRATPKTQSALLEAMQERAVTAAGVRHALPEPFLVLATQNPIEMEGTYPLPEAQVDRFLFKIRVLAPALSDLEEILDRTTGPPHAPPRPVLGGPDLLSMQALVRQVPAASHVRGYAARIALASNPEAEGASAAARKYVRYGASPRGAQALLLAAKALALLAGRSQASLEDVRAAALPALRHRVILNFEADAEGLGPDEVVKRILSDVPEVPGRAGELLKKS